MNDNEMREFLASLDLCIISSLQCHCEEGNCGRCKDCFAVGNQADSSVGIFQHVASPWFTDWANLRGWVEENKTALTSWAEGELEEIPA